MESQSVINILLIFSAAIAVIIISKQVRIPAVIGFILTGLIWSIFAPQNTESTTRLQNFGEIGIVFLLFLVGLDFSPEKVRRLGRIMLLGGGVQAVITVGVAALIASLGITSFTTAIIGAFVIIQSSTAIALKVYHDRGELNAPHAETSIGISLFQDISAVLLLLIIPLLGAGSGHHSSLPLGSLAVNFLILSAVSFTAYFLFPLILRLVVTSGIRELVILLALVFCIGFSILTQRLGFSMALGAFICGIMLNRSEYHSQIIADFAPFRDVFLSLFFISIGLGFDWQFTVSHTGMILGLTVAVYLLKSVILFISSRICGFPFRTSLLVGAGLGNIGEFGFIVMLAAVPFGLLTKSEFQTLGSISILSMLLTPLVILAVSKFTLRIPTLLKESRKSKKKIHNSNDPRIVIIGFGLAGKHLAHTLKSSSISYSVIEANGREVTSALANNEPIMFGDAARWETLERSGIERAQIMVVLISDPGAIRSCIGIARRINPKITIICRTRRMTEIEHLLKAGANEVISEEFETSIELFTVVLNHLHVPRNIIRAQTKLLRSDGYEMLRVPSPVKGVSDKLIQILAAGTTDVFQVMDDHFSQGKSLKSLDLRKITGAMVITVVKGDKNMTNPPPDLIIDSGDSLVIVGSHAQIESAFEYLENGPVDVEKKV
jgi:CPA2 family monovalent cation:H+ antiporter-2